MYRLLLVDDDLEVLQLNKKFFEKNQCQVKVCSDSKKAMDMVQSFKPECILLDVMMPGINGFLLCRQIRQVTNVPVLFLSGKISEEDKIKGFQCGADDYIEKPYSLKEVYIRVIANIRRNKVLTESTKQSNCIEIPPLTIDLEGHKVLYMTEEIPLSNREFELLLFMSKKANELITFEEIGMATWGAYTEDDRRSVMVNVSRLRKKLEDYGGLEHMIETVWSKGYKLVTK